MSTFAIEMTTMENEMPTLKTQIPTLENDLPPFAWEMTTMENQKATMAARMSSYLPGRCDFQFREVTSDYARRPTGILLWAFFDDYDIVLVNNNDAAA